MKKLFIAASSIITLMSAGFFGASALAQTAPVIAPYYPQPTSYCPTLSYNLYRGLYDYQTGGQVTALQQFLSSQGYSQSVTGYFGPMTANNVAQFQRAHAVYPITGGVGPLTRAAIAQICGTGGGTQSSTFYLNQAFTLSVNQATHQYNGQLDVTLNSISSPQYTYTTAYPSYGYGSATFTLGQRCAAGTQCFYYPQQQFTLSQGQSTTWQGYTVTLTSLSQNSATFVVSTTGNGGGTTTQGSLSANPISGQAPLNVSFAGTITGTVNSSGQYIINYGDGQDSGAVQAYCPGTGNCTVATNHTYTSAGTYTAYLSPYIACMYSNPRCMIAVQYLGQTTITVSGQSTVGGMTVTSPTAGQQYARGTQMSISWSYPVTPGSANVVLDLYTAAGAKVGTIAISNNTSGSYTWSIPPFPNNLACTLQYPNGLCGQNLQGQFYIVASATAGTGLDNFTPIATSQSGVFTIY